MADHNEPAEWQYQTAMCSQTFEELPDQLEQLIIGREGRGDKLEEEEEEEKASEWFTQLPELDNVNDFLRELWAHFEDSSRAQEAKAQIKSIRQKGKPAKELMLEFRCLATNLRHWLERMLVHYFKESLDEELLKICLCCELPDDRIHEWYQIAIAMDNALKQH
ncbi:hypothetical protein L345_08375, partial [Ophiophagus hannah]